MNDHKLSYYDLESVIDALNDLDALNTEEELLSYFRENLNDCTGIIEFNVGGVNFTIDPADWLEENDPTAFRTGFNDWLDSEGYEEIILNDTLYWTNDIHAVEEAIDAKIEELEEEEDEDEN